MTKTYPMLLILTFIVILSSCVTVHDKTVQPHERDSVEIIGRVETNFIAMQPLHITSERNISRRAYLLLMEEARRNFQGDIDVVNITASGDFNWLTLILPVPFMNGMIGNFQTVSAIGDVIINSGEISLRISQEQMENTAKIVSSEMIDRLPRDSVIAVLSVYSSDSNTSEYIIGELEYNLVNSGRFRIVDRRRLDQIRTEQNFHLSGEVSDASAISIGNMLGANIVILGEITGSGQNQRLILRAFDVTTAQIVTMVRVQF
jgi:hypothetical protein